MSGEPKRYELRTVSDFLALPPEKVHDCLIDFQNWLSASALLREVEPLVFQRHPDMFLWLDDGAHDAHVTITGPGGVVVVREVIPMDSDPAEAARPEESK